MRPTTAAVWRSLLIPESNPDDSVHLTRYLIGQLASLFRDGEPVEVLQEVCLGFQRSAYRKECDSRPSGLGP